MLKKFLLIVVLAVGASLGAGGLLAPATALAQQAKLSKKVGEPLAAALDAAKKGQYSQALAKLKAADGVSGKTAFEQYQINETYGFVYLKQKNYAAAASAYERSLSSGQIPAGQVNDRVKQLAQLNFQTPRNLNKVIEYSNRYLKATGGSDPAMHAMLGQAYQLQGNDKAAVASVQTAVRQSGGKPAENWLRILLKSYGALGDTKGVSETTEKLVSLYPTQENWRLLSSALRKQASGDDRTAMNVYRLMGELDLMDKPDVYNEAAIVAIQSGLPQEGVRIMEKGYEKQVFGPADEARSQRIMGDARKKAAAQQASLPKLTQAASASAAGQDEVTLGEVLLSYGQTDQAIAAGKRALKKGATDEAWMLLGRSHVQQKNGPEARKAFAQVKGAETASIAKLWGIYASRI